MIGSKLIKDKTLTDDDEDIVNKNVDWLRANIFPWHRYLEIANLAERKLKWRVELLQNFWTKLNIAQD